VWIGFFFVLAYVNVGKQLWMLTIVKYPGDCHVILDIKIVNDIKIYACCKSGNFMYDAMPVYYWRVFQLRDVSLILHSPKTHTAFPSA
jgi:hypothetical protein